VRTILAASVLHDFLAVFDYLFKFFGWLLAQLYGFVPNYAVAITLLTIIIMAVLTPLTVKSTKSMVSMQRMQPEIKKLQQKYKGPENRQVLNEELMRLYREEGINPLGGCVPVLLQAPFLLVLYRVIRGLANVTKAGVSQPLYIPHSSRMYRDLIAAHGKMNSFGMNLALKPFSAHGSVIAAIPFFVIPAIAVGLQYFQMWQVNNRAKRTGNQAPSQQQAIMRVMPVFFAFIYLEIPAAVVVYMVVSTIIRIITQDVMFRLGISNPQAQPEREIPAREERAEPKPSTTAKRAIPAPKNPGAPRRPTPARPSPPRQSPSTKPSTPHPRSKAKKPRKDR
jgi:YidC/Oxa1 family membrane protein insertase